jgi:2-oxoisovalerate dehydrogenase E1 component
MATDVLEPRAKKAKKKKSLLAEFSKEQLAYFYKTIVTGRKMDEKFLILLKQGKSSFHIGTSGHEAAQVAMAACMKPAHDWAYPYYRDLTFSLTYGTTIEHAMLEFLAKADGPSTGGRQMYGHWGDEKLHIVSQSSPTGTQYLQAVGTAMGCKRNGSDEIVYASSGEGTTSQGDFHEAVNWASREKLPVIFLIQDNGYAISVPIKDQTSGQSVYKMTAGYEGLYRFDVDGTDFFEVYEAAKEAVEITRQRKGAVLINANVVRLLPHSSSDNHDKYRTKEELDADKLRDPITKYEKRMLEDGIFTRDELDKMQSEVKTKIDEAALWAEGKPDPDPADVEAHVWSDKKLTLDFENPLARGTGADIVMVDAINHALDEELSNNPKMLVYGEDVGGNKGGVFTATQGLTKKYGDRVFNSPLAESSIVGTAIGLAVMGYKPVVEIQFADYIWTAMMQIRDELVMMRYRSKDRWSCPVVMRVATGGYIHGAHYHSQNIEAFFAHCPGLVIVYPSNAEDAKGLLKTACRADDPVLFLEHKYLYRQGFAKSPEPSKDYFVPFGKAKTVREGTDLSIITWGALVQRSLEAARRMEKEGVSVEVIDLRTILPYDKEAVLATVRKTNKVLVAHEDNITQGFGAEIAAFIAENCFMNLDAPIMRLGGTDTPIPYHPALEEAALPNEEKIYAKLKQLAAF